MKLLASARSAGRTYDWDGATITVEELTENSFGDVDIALFSAGGSISKKFAPLASAAGATVVDNSSAFRMTEGVPLVIPEINPEAMKGMKAGKGGIVANPNCSTIIALVAVTPLHKAATVKRMVVSTYQAASGAGQAAMGELERERERERILRVLEFFLSGRDSTRRKQGGKLTLLFLLLSLSLPLSPHVTPPPPPQTSSSSRPARPLKGRR
jgi:aspartate-semialdehyde dehydrogenase